MGKPKVSVFVAMSLDGFIARTDGGLDWLDAANKTVPAGEDCGYSEFMQSVDLLIMGRKTYEKVLSFGGWPYGEIPVTVLSSNPIVFSDETPNTVSHSSEEPGDLYERLVREGVNHVYVDGGVTIQRFLSARLVDELTITIIPILLGKGISLFGSLDAAIHVTCVEVKEYDFGFVQHKYSVEKET